jgi:predicted GNAT superfamily acetyltransferase
VTNVPTSRSDGSTAAPKPVVITDEFDDALVLALNNAHAAETSLLTLDRLVALRAQALIAAGVARGGDAFVIALDDATAYDNPNFAWFKARFDRFVYVDRIITAPHARGRGLARALYQHVFDRAAAAGHVRVVCEVNAEPPNPASDAFHAALGFEPLDRQAVRSQHKIVSYLVRRL